jgi:hypothetical protein
LTLAIEWVALHFAQSELIRFNRESGTFEQE